MITLTTSPPETARGDMLVWFAWQTGKKRCGIDCAPVRKLIQPVWRAGDFTGRGEETLLLYPASAGRARIAAARVLAVGCGKVEKDHDRLREQLRTAAGRAATRAREVKARRVVVILPDRTALPAAEVAECVSEGLILGNYHFSGHRTVKKDEDPPVRVKRFVLCRNGLKAPEARRGMVRGEIAAEAACAARDMANEPGNYWTPARFGDFGRRLARATSLTCTVLGKQELKKLGMGGILAVNQGSALPPRLVILEYRTAGKNPTLLLVGKGLTFDSGGVSLKPAAGMEEMKYDMCGGAAVLAAMQGVAGERPEGINVVGLVPATDNMSGAGAVRPGDVITHYNGTTSEVVNTDAEGRLILADALAYGIRRFKPDAVIDLATLTGAVIIGLGHHRTGLMANDDSLADQIIAAGASCGEPLWRLPLGPEYTRQLKSEVADLKNVGGRAGGTITAACYLQEFVGNTPWAHLDIAGTAWNFTDKPYIPKKGPSGTGVRTLLNLIRHWNR